MMPSNVPALIKKIQVVAFIVAAIIVVVVVFSSIHKWKTPEEKQIGVPPSETTETELGQPEEEVTPPKEGEEEVTLPVEEVTPAVKIESASVTFKKRDAISPDQYLCEVKMSGSATLRFIPDYVELKFVGCFDDDIERSSDKTCRFEIASEDIANFVGSTLTCPSWTQRYGYSGCDRLSGQPATGEWSLTFTDWFYPWRGHKKTYFAYVPGKTWDSPRVWDSVTLTCQP